MAVMLCFYRTRSPASDISPGVADSTIAPLVSSAAVDNWILPPLESSPRWVARWLPCVHIAFSQRPRRCRGFFEDADGP